MAPDRDEEMWHPIGAGRCLKGNGWLAIGMSPLKGNGWLATDMSPLKGNGWLATDMSPRVRTSESASERSLGRERRKER